MAKGRNLIPPKRERRKTPKPVLGFKVRKEMHGHGSPHSNYYSGEVSLAYGRVITRGLVSQGYNLHEVLMDGVLRIPKDQPKPSRLVVSLDGEKSFDQAEKREIADYMSLYGQAKRMNVEIAFRYNPKDLGSKASSDTQILPSA